MAKGMRHYKRDGTLFTGNTHKMSNGDLHSGKTHGKTSVKLYHFKDLSDRAKKKPGESNGRILSTAKSTKKEETQEENQEITVLLFLKYAELTV